MQYDWNRPLLPGTVVCSKFNNFEGKETIGIFVILYDEQGDNNISDTDNVIAIKLSSKGTCISNYCVGVDTKLNNFMNDDSVACCSKLHTLHKKQQIYKVLGILHPATWHNIYKQYMKFASNLQTQMMNEL